MKPKLLSEKVYRVVCVSWREGNNQSAGLKYLAVPCVNEKWNRDTHITERYVIIGRDKAFHVIARGAAQSVLASGEAVGEVTTADDGIPSDALQIVPEAAVIKAVCWDTAQLTAIGEARDVAWVHTSRVCDCQGTEDGDCNEQE